MAFDNIENTFMIKILPRSRRVINPIEYLCKKT